MDIEEIEDIDRKKTIKMDTMNKYKWLEKHFPDFINKIGLKWGIDVNEWIFSAHGDKCPKYYFDGTGLHEYHGLAIYLLTHIRPYDKECREIEGKWVEGKYVKGVFKKPIDWVFENKDKILPYLSKEDLN